MVTCFVLKGSYCKHSVGILQELLSLDLMNEEVVDFGSIILWLVLAVDR